MESGTSFEFGNVLGVMRAFQKGIILGSRTSGHLGKVYVGWGGSLLEYSVYLPPLLSPLDLDDIERCFERRRERGRKRGREGGREEKRERREREGERGEGEGKRRSSRSEIATIKDLKASACHNTEGQVCASM